MTQENFSIAPPVIAHRGLSGRAPENTMVAFTKAAQAGIKWVEFDVMLAACGTPVVFHDELLQRTTNMRGNLKDYSYHQLRSLDAGAWFDPSYAGEKIPGLEQVMEWLVNNKMSANIEIKPHPGQEAETVARALPIIGNYFPQQTNQILFSSFAIDSMRELRRNLPNANLGFLMHDWEDAWRSVCDDLACVSVNVNHEIMTPERAALIKQTGRRIFSYTVNSTQRAAALFEMGVDAVFSDYPDKILLYLNNEGHK